MAANGSGGFNNSGAPLSPPGALSKRTDMQSPMALPDAAYGEQAAFQEIQAGAPMAGEPAPPDIFSDTMRPDVPVTDGADYGPGVGSEALPTANTFDTDNAMIAKYMPQFEQMAAMEGTPDSFRQFVQYIRGSR